MVGRTDISPRLRDMTPSATLAINELSRAREAAGLAVTKFGLGQSPFPVPEAVVRALQSHAHEKDYLPIRGLAELRTTLLGYFQARVNVQYHRDNILIGPGSKELMFILQLVLARQLVLPQGAWVSYGPQAVLAGGAARWLPTYADDGWRLRPERLIAAARNSAEPLLLILNYPSNPTGQTYTADELSALAAVCRQYDILVLSDEIYGELAFDGQYQSIATHYPEGTIISTGLSKWCGAGGWRLGVFALPAQLSEIADAMAVVASETFTSVSAPTQYAAIEAFKLSGALPQYLENSRTVLKFINQTLCEKLASAGIDVLPAEGGFYIMPDFDRFRSSLAKRGISDSQQLCQDLLTQTGVALLPGTCFGFPAEKLITRLAFVDFEGTDVLADLTRIDAATALQPSRESVLKTHSALKRLWKGADALCDWVRQS